MGGLVDFLFGSGSKTVEDQKQSSTSKTKGTQDSKQTQQQQTAQTSKGSQQQEAEKTGTQTATISQYTEQDLGILSQLTKALSSGIGGTGGADLLSAVTKQSAEGTPAVLGALLQKALTSTDRSAEIKKAQQEAAIAGFERTGARDVAQAQQQIGAGSEFNTASRLLDQEARAKLGVDLAGLSANTDIALGEQERIDLLAALQGAGVAGESAAGIGEAAIRPLLETLTLARGAETRSTQSLTEASKAQVVTEEEQKQLVDILSQLLTKSTQETDSSGTGTAVSTGTQKGSIIGGVTSLISALRKK